MESFNLKKLLGPYKRTTLSFSQFVERFIEQPKPYLSTSSSLVSEAIQHFGFQISIRSGEPIVSYNIFKDLFFTGINAVFGQEHCIKYIVDVIESVEKESGPNRGIVLVGPPASGKTNIIDLLSRAVEEYTKQRKVKLYSFYFHFKGKNGNSVDVRSSFHHNPILLFPTITQDENGNIYHPRQELFKFINKDKKEHEKILIPTYYQDANLDKRSLDILESLRQNPENKKKSLFDIIEEYIRIEEIEFSNAQAKGISNIDDMYQLNVRLKPLELGNEKATLINQHLLGKSLYQYEGSMIDSNRGILHIHDSFGTDLNGLKEKEYKPLLMLLGSGKVSIESTQSSVDNTVFMTTNIEEMEMLERQLTSSKLLDRIEKIPVNYLLDANAEMDILRRDMSNMKEDYDVDPNLLKVAAYYSVMTRLLPPHQKKLPSNWSDAKKSLYYSITPEQKLFIYASQAEDPIRTIKKLPQWHPFHNELLKLGLHAHDQNLEKYIVKHPEAIHLAACNLFGSYQLKLIDDEFMRTLWNEHYPNEGKHGISVRQLQNIMRNTIAKSDGKKIHVGIFLSQLEKIIEEGGELHHWLIHQDIKNTGQSEIPSRTIGNTIFREGEGDYNDFKGLVYVVQAIYYQIIEKEITISTVDRDPSEIEYDLRKYLQHILLTKAHHNKTFSHIMIPKYTFIDSVSGNKVEEPDLDYMKMIERIICKRNEPKLFRNEIAQKFLDLQSAGELNLAEGVSIISSKEDNLLECFSKEYSMLLSHRKVDKEINPELLKTAFFFKQNNPEEYFKSSPVIRKFVEMILNNMSKRFRYSRTIAIDTIVFALRKRIINFEKILS